MTVQRAGGPFFDDLVVGDVVAPGPLAPALTLTAATADAHRAIVGDRLALSLSAPLARAVVGREVLPPALVWDVAIGQSTALTRRVVANLFYRGLAFHRFPAPGDTLATRTEVVGLRRSRSKPVGLAALRISTTDDAGRTVLDFWRCAMLPLSPDATDAPGAPDAPGGGSGPDDDLDAIGAAVAPERLEAATAGWDLTGVPGVPGVTAPEPGSVLEVPGGDVVGSAPELARLTLNIAAAHHDRRAGDGRRLVYGGHTIAIALAQTARALPGLVTVLAWDRCEHTGPVHEGDTLASTVTVGSLRPAATPGGLLAELGTRVAVVDDGDPRAVLDWSFTALLAT